VNLPALGLFSGRYNAYLCAPLKPSFQRQSRWGLSIVWAMLCSGCSRPGTVVNRPFVDSLLDQFALPSLVRTNAAEIQFWEKKREADPGDSGAWENLSNRLLMRYRLLGDIGALGEADRLLSTYSSGFAGKDPILPLSRAAVRLLQQRFPDAASFAVMAGYWGGQKKLVSEAIFDADIGMGAFDSAGARLSLLRRDQDFGYYFRLGQWLSVEGFPDSAAAAYHLADSLALTSDFLRQLALSGRAEFSLARGDAQLAAGLSESSIRLNPTDFASLCRLGRISWIVDRDDSLSGKIFHFLAGHWQTPEAFYWLSGWAGSQKDSGLQQQWADSCLFRINDSSFGNVGSRNAIGLCTGILHAPSQAIAIAKKAVYRNACAQTYSWYVWALASGRQADSAALIFKEKVQGKWLGAQENYWMGNYLRAKGDAGLADSLLRVAYSQRMLLSLSEKEELEGDFR